MCSTLAATIELSPFLLSDAALERAFMRLKVLASPLADSIRAGILLAQVGAVCVATAALGCRTKSDPEAPQPAADRVLEREINASADALGLEKGVLTRADADAPWWLADRSRMPLTSPALPTEWGDLESDAAWSAEIPGRGHASPVVVGQKVLIATAHEVHQRQMVVCYDRMSGALLWNTVVHQGGFPAAEVLHKDSSHASSTLATDGDRVYATFFNDGRIIATALSLRGHIEWQTAVGSFSPYMGYSSSPLLYATLIIIVADDVDGGFIAAVDRDHGQIVWRKKRPPGASHSSPALVTVSGIDQVVVTGLGKTIGYAPATGESLWSIEGPTSTAVATPVEWNGVVVASGGYPEEGVVCIHLRQEESQWFAEARWKNEVKVYVPSLLPTRQGLVAVADNGVAYLWSYDDGHLMHRLRLGGNYYASPIANGDFIYAASREGEVSVLRIDQDRLARVASNSVRGEIMATPVIAGGDFFLRVTMSSDEGKKEKLYCIRERKVVQK